MSKLEELIERYCPNGVPNKKIGEVSLIVTKQTGFDYSATIKPSLIQINDGDSLPYIQTRNFSGKNFDYETEFYIPNRTAEMFPKILLDSKCLLISIVGSIGNVGIFPGTTKCFLGGAICVVKTKDTVNIDFLYYCLESPIGQKQLRKKTKGSGQATVTIEDIRNFEFPFPPLEVQNEIASILNKFNSLISELSSELVNRNKQYDYLLTELFENKVDGKVVKLSSIACFSQGLQVDIDKQKQDYFEGSIRFLRIVDFVNNDELPRYIEKPQDKFIKKDGELVMIRYGASAAGKVFIKYTGAIANNMFKINIMSKDVETKYLYYFLSQKRIYESLNHVGSGSTMPAVNFKMVSDIDVFIPSIETQRDIVAKIEIFNDYFSGKSSCLGSEIEARQKQYEYYRDKLLSFKELES